jgi:hypothetical protein
MGHHIGPTAAIDHKKAAAAAQVKTFKTPVGGHMRRLAVALGWLISAPVAAATFTVVNTNNSGAGSLRQAILDANASAGFDTIAFNIPGAGVHTITPTSQVPTITDTATIDGYTQPGTSPNTQLTSDDAVLLIEINGESSGDGYGLFTDGTTGVTIRGLVINRFSSNVFLHGDGHFLEGCFIGTDPTGTIARGGGDGVYARGSTIGGALPSLRNVISGNSGFGVWTNGGFIQGNFIGIDATGTTALPNGTNVLAAGAGSARTTIGGPAAPAGAPPGNVISGSLSEGIRFIPHCQVCGPYCQVCTTASIQGNLIGTNAAGTAAVPNLGHGVVAERFCDPERVPRRCSSAGIGGGNVIAYNLGDGIAGHAFIGSNSIHSNSGLGIDLGVDGPDPNVEGSGSNTPILIAAISYGGSTTILGTYNGHPGWYGAIELFSSSECDASGYGEGATPIGSTTVTTDAQGNASFSVVLPLSLELGSVVTGTTSTSEFSACRIVTDGLPFLVLSVAPTSGGAAGGTPVTVAGFGFLPDASLTIGGAMAENVIVVGSTEIDATTPSLSPGTLNDVAVTNGSLQEDQPLQTAILAKGWLADFLDVPQSEIFHDDIEKIFRNAITAGYGNGYYGINDPVTRAQMAVFLLKGKHGSLYTPPPCTGVFADVECTPVPAFAVDWIEQLFDEGITAGCLPLGNYCPSSPVRRDEMAVFLLKSKYGSAHTPPPCTGIFSDVECTPTPAFAVDWIEQLDNENITGGCLPVGNYCPSASVTRGQMAVFLTRTFNLQ